jgi:hypothetical protein
VPALGSQPPAFSGSREAEKVGTRFGNSPPPTKSLVSKLQLEAVAHLDPAQLGRDLEDLERHAGVDQRCSCRAGRPDE